MKRRKRTIRRIDPSEHSLQTQLLGILTYALRSEICVVAIPNQSNRHINNAVKMKAEGMRRGAADLLFMFPVEEGAVGWLEMKTRTGSLSDYQIGFSAICERLGHRWAMARSVDQALDVLRGWNALKPGVNLYDPMHP
jgi:hypothetical protein